MLGGEKTRNIKKGGVREDYGGMKTQHISCEKKDQRSFDGIPRAKTPNGPPAGGFAGKNGNQNQQRWGAHMRKAQ